MTRNDVAAVLESIRITHGGVLRPTDVLAEATLPTHPLHDGFEWDDTKAAHAHRLWQARVLITSVTIERGGQKIPRYFSLSIDRIEEGGGYRSVETVMAEASLRIIALRDALRDLEIFRLKYRRLQELAGVLAAIGEVEKEQFTSV